MNINLLSFILFIPNVLACFLTLILFSINSDLKEEFINNYICALEGGAFLNEEI